MAGRRPARRRTDGSGRLRDRARRRVRPTQAAAARPAAQPAEDIRAATGYSSRYTDQHMATTRPSPVSPRKNRHAAPVDPGGSGPSQPANERPPSQKQGGKRGGTAVCPHGSGCVALAARVQGRTRHRQPEEKMATYPRAGASEVPAQPDFPELEQRALAYWNAHETFKQRIENRADDGGFVFY